MSLSFRVRAAIAIGTTLLILAFIFTRENRIPERQNIVAWSGSGTLVQAREPAQEASAPSSQNFSSDLGVALDPQQLQSLTAQTESHADRDFQMILDQITNTPVTFASEVDATAAADAIREAFAMVPQLNTSSATAVPAQQRTPVQEAIYAYGNAVGSIIKAYESEHPNALGIVSDQSKDRTNPGKALALKALAADIADIGSDILTVPEVPKSVASDHERLAQSYREAGTLLAKVADARDDAAVVAAITAYTKAVNTLTERYGSLATYFSLAGVRFSAQDGGSVFSFGSF